MGRRSARCLNRPHPAARSRRCSDFRALIEGLQQEVSSESPADFLQSILTRSGYLDMLTQRDSSEDTARADNLRELVNAMAEGAERGETLTDFLDRAALVSDADNFDEDALITLMTLHSAKGLEFDHVFLTGLEEGIFPHSRSQNDNEELEEERRLCYVGMTRAKETLTLTRAVYRRMYGIERLYRFNAVTLPAGNSRRADRHGSRLACRGW